MAAVELDGSRPVEVIECDPFFEASLKEPPFELLGIPALDEVRFEAYAIASWRTVW